MIGDKYTLILLPVAKINSLNHLEPRSYIARYIIVSEMPLKIENIIAAITLLCLPCVLYNDRNLGIAIAQVENRLNICAYVNVLLVTIVDVDHEEGIKSK